MSEPWALRLFRKSPLKRDKVAALLSALGEVKGKRCLDLGSDNGVVSLLLRQQGGSWASGDLTAETVEAIRGLVETDVHLVEENRLPFASAEFDVVVVADMIEHVEDEAAFVAEIARVLKPGGRLIVNTPHARNTALRRLRLRLGQTDEKHGHVRPGYTRESLGALLREDFVIDESSTYTKAFSETVDTAMQWALESLGKKGSKKGVVVTGGDLNRHAKLFKVYSLVFPFVWGFSRLDALLPANDGYRLLLSATRKNA
ncbi:MAG: class I SAM-dependent methyltransferase [Vicinamibacteria bacterium]|nr:class I SAM-dependent methyltransferase [Vicinamibacteria bacterium]